MGTTSEKLQYLATTKTLLKNKINITGANITTDTFRQYPTKLQNALLECWNNEGEPIFTNWGTKVNGEGTNVKLDNTINARMKLTPKGNTTQNGTPTPSSPINVNVVSGDNEVVVCGKNLFDITQYPILQRVAYNGSGNKVAWASYVGVEEYIPINSNTTYTITSSLNINLDRVVYYDSSKNILSNITSISTFTTPNNAKYIRFCYYTPSETIPTWLQLEVGNSSSTYQPYTSQNYPLYLGVENLFNGANVYTSNTTNWTISFVNNVLTITHNNSYTTGVPVLEMGTLPSGTYVLSGTLEAGIGLYINGTYNKMLTNGSTFTTDGTQSIRLQISVDANDTNTYTNVMIEKGTTPSSYTPYGTTPIELCDIGNYTDLFFKAINGDKYYDTLTQAQKDLLTYGKWYLHKEVGKVVLNGSESWSYEGGRFVVNFLINALNTSGRQQALSNYFSYVASGSASYGIFIYKASDTNYQIYIYDADYTTANDFKTWLGTHNTNVYYILNTPIEEEITNTTLINQLETLKDAMSYEGQTNINGGFMIVGASALGVM